MSLKDWLIEKTFSEPTLFLVKSDEKRSELLGILGDADASHYQRLYLVGFLGSIGYSLEDVMTIIDHGNHWKNYSRRTTLTHVDGIFRGHRSWRTRKGHSRL